MPVLGRNVPFQHGRLDGLKDTGLDHVVQAPDVHRENGVSGAVAALRLDLFQHAAFGIDHIDFDHGPFGEFLQDRVDQEGLSVGIEIDFIGRAGGRGGDERDPQRPQGGH